MLKKNIFLGSFLITILIPTFVWALNDNRSEDSFTGRDLYRLNCAGCHGVDRTGNPPYYPSLGDVKGKLSKKQVMERLIKGGERMPVFSHLSDHERKAIISFLFREEEKTVKLSPERVGENIFKSNCVGCHRATANDPKPPNVRMMEPAPLAGATKRFTKDEFFKILEMGICYMPSFEHFTLKEKATLYSFVKSLEEKGEPERPTMGEMCPMLMKMRKGGR